MTGYRVVGRSRRSIERAAANIRRILDIDPLLPLPGWELFELIGRHHVEIGGQKIRLSYGIEETLPGDALACATYSKDENAIVVLLSAESYEDLEQRNGGRAKFSVAHEIGHAVLHPEKLMQLTRIDHTRRLLLRSDATAETPAYQDSEWQANYFAAALLMPAPGLDFLRRQGRLESFEVTRLYRVSRISARLRVATFQSHPEILMSW